MKTLFGQAMKRLKKNNAALLWLCAGALFYQPYAAMALIVSDPITEAETTNTTVQTTVTAGATTGLFAASVAKFVQDLLEYQQLNGGLGMIYDASWMQLRGQEKLAKGMADSQLEGMDRLSRLIPTSTAAASAAVNPATTLGCAHYAIGAVDADSDNWVNANNSITSQLSAQVNIGSSATTPAGYQVGTLSARCGSGWSFEDSNTISVCTNTQ